MSWDQLINQDHDISLTCYLRQRPINCEDRRSKELLVCIFLAGSLLLKAIFVQLVNEELVARKELLLSESRVIDECLIL